jgi:hypothetical protein
MLLQKPSPAPIARDPRASTLAEARDTTTGNTLKGVGFAQNPGINFYWIPLAAFPLQVQPAPPMATLGTTHLLLFRA